jgi:hypothetical protein
MVPRTSYALEVRDICNIYMNGRHTRNKRVMKRVSNAVMTRECHADVLRMLCECCEAPLNPFLNECICRLFEGSVWELGAFLQTYGKFRRQKV